MVKGEKTEYYTKRIPLTCANFFLCLYIARILANLTVSSLLFFSSFEDTKTWARERAWAEASPWGKQTTNVSLYLTLTFQDSKTKEIKKNNPTGTGLWVHFTGGVIWWPTTSCSTQENASYLPLHFLFFLFFLEMPVNLEGLRKVLFNNDFIALKLRRFHLHFSLLPPLLYLIIPTFNSCLLSAIPCSFNNINSDASSSCTE